MPDEDTDTQITPEGEDRAAVRLPGRGGKTIPVPEKADVLAALRKVAKANEADENP